MRKDWKPVRLGDICVTNTKTYSVSEKWPFINYLDTGNITENRIEEIQHLVMGKDTLPSRARRMVSIDDILYSTVRPNQRHYGIIKEVLPNMLVSTGFAVITPDKSKSDPDFLYYYLTQNDIVDGLHAIGEQSVSAYPSIKPSDIEGLEMLLPPLQEQVEIGRTLRALDDKIANNSKINHHLEQMAQAIFKSWFVDFVPWGGVMPSDWTETQLFDLATVMYGKNLPTKKLLKSGYRVYGGNGQIGYYSAYLYEKERILISCRGAASGSVRISRPFSFVTNNTLVVNEKNSYSYAYLKQWCLNRQFFEAVTGSAQPQVTVDSLKLIPIVVPTIQVQIELLNFLQPLYNKIEATTIETEKLVELRDTLLPKLMSGEVSVN